MIDADFFAMYRQHRWRYYYMRLVIFCVEILLVFSVVTAVHRHLQRQIQHMEKTHSQQQNPVPAAPQKPRQFHDLLSLLTALGRLLPSVMQVKALVLTDGVASIDLRGGDVNHIIQFANAIPAYRIEALQKKHDDQFFLFLRMVQ